MLWGAPDFDRQTSLNKLLGTGKMSKDNNTTNGVVQRKGEAPELSKLPAREKLPAGLQKIVDDEETLYERLYDGTCVLSRSPVIQIKC